MAGKNQPKPSAHRSGLLQWSAYRALDAALSSALSQHRLSAPEWKLLGLVSDAGELRSAEIAFALQVKAPLVTRNLGTLQKKHLVRIARSMEDRRVRCVTVTEEGERRLRAAEKEVRKALAPLLAGVTRQELDAYVAVLRKIVSNGLSQGRESR